MSGIRKIERRLERQDLGSNVKRRGKLQKGLGILIASAMLLGTNVSIVSALPQGGQVVAGVATMAQQGADLAINQLSQNAVINWQTFNIASGESVSFFQPNSSASVLNRVIGNNASEIFGQLNANGNIFLVNPAGIFFAPTAQVNAGSIIATSLNISNADFMAGRYAFIGSKNSGDVINQGKLIADNEGTVALLAPKAENDGVIVAKKGTAIMTAGTEMTLDFNGDGKINVKPSQEAVDLAVVNKGIIEAEGGLVFLTAQTGEQLTSSVVNQSGIIKATGFDKSVGKVQITANDIVLSNNSFIDVSGNNGGSVEVGGSWQGSGSLPHAQKVTMERGATIKADAVVDNGRGGTVVLWSDGATNFQGDISATGKGYGRGGSVETSGSYLVTNGRVNASSEKGEGGEWLLDPTNIEIVDDASVTSIGSNYTPSASSRVKVSSIVNTLNAGTSVTITTGGATNDAGDITVNATINKTAGGNATLSLSAHQSIIVNKDITSTSGKLDVVLKSDTDNQYAGYILLKDATINSNGGSVKLHGGTNNEDVDTRTYASTASPIHSGIELNNSKIITQGGNVDLYGSSSAGASKAILLNNASVIDSGTGTTSLYTAHMVAGTTELVVDSSSIVQGTNVIVNTDNMDIQGQITGDGTGTFTLAQRTDDFNISLGGSTANINLPLNLFDPGSGKISLFKSAIIGSSTATGKVSVDSAWITPMDLTLRSPKGAIDLNANISGAGRTLTLIAGTNVVSSSATLELDKLVLDAANAAVNLIGNNNVSTIAGKAGSIKYNNTADLIIGDDTDGLILKSGDSAITGGGNINIAKNITSADNAVLTLTTATGKNIKLADNVSVTAASNKSLAITVNTGEIVMGEGSKLASGTGNITLNTDELSYSPTATDFISGTGILNIDGFSAGRAINLGTVGTGLNIDHFNIFKAGFSKINVGSDTTGNIAVADVTASSPLNITSGSTINFNGGTVATNGKNLSLRANIVAYNSPQTLDIGTTGNATLSIQADNFTNWSNVSFANAGADTNKSTLSVKHKTNGTNYTVGGATGYVDNTALAKMKAGNFWNVAVGDANDTATLTIDAITDMPQYLSLLTSGLIYHQGPITDGTDKTLALFTNTGVNEGTTNDINVGNLLLWGTGTFALDTTKNKINNLAADISAGTIRFKNSGNLASRTIENRNNNTSVAGIKADVIKLRAEDSGKLTISSPIVAANEAELVADDMAITAGAITTANALTLKTVTANKDINLGTNTGAGNWNLAGSTFGSLIIGDATYQGNINLDNVTLAGDTTLTTQKNVTLTGTNNIGTNADKNLTVNADRLTLPSATDRLNLKGLTVNLNQGLDLGAGKIKGEGSLKIRGVQPHQDVFVSNTYNSATDSIPNGYKIAYSSLAAGGNLEGFTAIDITSPNNVYFDSGTIGASVDVTAGDATTGYKDIIFREQVVATGTSVNTINLTGRNLTFNAQGAGKPAGGLIINDVAADSMLKATMSGNIELGNSANLVANNANGISVALLASDNSGNVIGNIKIGDNARVEVNTDTTKTYVPNRISGLRLSSSDLNLGANSLAKTGSSAPMTLRMENLVTTGADSDTVANVSGTQVRVVSADNDKTIVLGTDTTGGTGINITNAQLNGGIFDNDIRTLVIGSESFSTVGTNKNVILNGVTVGSGRTLYVNPSNKLTIAGGGVAVNGGGNFSARSAIGDNLSGVGFIEVGAGTGSTSTDLYFDNWTNFVKDSTSTATNPKPIVRLAQPLTGNRTATLGLRSNTGKTIALGDNVTEPHDIEFNKSFMTELVGAGFTTHNIGGINDNIIVGNHNVGVADAYKPNTVLAGRNITFTGEAIFDTNPLTLRSSVATSQTTGSKLVAGNLLLRGFSTTNITGDYVLDSTLNKIGNIATNAVNKVAITSDTLTVDTVAGFNGINATGDITLTTDNITLNQKITPLSVSSDTQTLIIQQKSADRDLYLGINPVSPATGLIIPADNFNGSKIATGFKEVHLGRATNSTGTAYVGGDLKFVNPVTIHGLNEVKLVNATVATVADAGGNNKALTIDSGKLTMDANSTLTAGNANLRLAVDDMDIAGASNSDARIFGTGELQLRTRTLTRKMNLGETTSTDALNLKSEYFQDGTDNKRIFRDGFSLIRIGNTEATGALNQSGITSFTDPVNIEQGLNVNGGTVTVTGTIYTNGNEYTVSSRKVELREVIIYNYGTGTGPGAGTASTSIRTDEIVVDELSKIYTDGEVSFGTYTSGMPINLGTPASGASSGLNLKDSIFGTNGLFGVDPNNPARRLKRLVIGDGSNNNVTVGDLTLGDNVVNELAFNTAGSVSSDGALKNVDKLLVTNASTVNLNNEGNEIKSIGAVNATDRVNIVTSGGTAITDKVEAVNGVNITNKTSGNVVIDDNGSIVSPNSTVYITAENGRFINNNTSNTPAINAGRFIIATEDSVGNVEGNLVNIAYRYGVNYGDTSFLNSTTYYNGKNIFTFKIQPTLVIYGERQYRDGLQAFFKSGNSLKDSYQLKTEGVAGDTADSKAARDAHDRASLAYMRNKIGNAPSNAFDWGNMELANANVDTNANLLDNKIQYGSRMTTANGFGTADEYVVSFNSNNPDYNPLNYKIETEFRITPAPLTVTPKDYSKTYDGTAFSGGNPVETVKYNVTGLRGSDNVANVLTVNNLQFGTLTDTATLANAEGAKYVGNYAIGMKNSDIGSNTNYYIVYQDGRLSITPRAITVKPTDTSRIYGAANPTNLTMTTVTGSSLGQNDSLQGVSISIDPNVATSALAVGSTAPITAQGAKIYDNTGRDVTANYNITINNGTLSIDKRDIYVRAGDRQRTYGEANTALTNVTSQYSVRATDNTSGLVNGDTIASVTTDDSLISTSYDAQSNANKYIGVAKVKDATLTNAGNMGNYNFIYDTGDLIINKALVTIKANNDTKTYDGLAYNAGTSGASYSGFLFGHDVDTMVGKTGTLSYSVPLDSIHAGTHAISLGGDLASTNYRFAYQNGTLLVNPRAITVRGEQGVRYYGEDNSATRANATIVAGTLASGDGMIIADVNDPLITAGTDVGVYNFSSSTFTMEDGSVGRISDYVITDQGGTLEIKPREVYIKADDKERIFGLANPAPTASVLAPTASTGLVFGASITGLEASYNTIVPSTAPIGTYANVIDPVQGTWTLVGGNMRNYIFNYRQGSLKVAVAGLTAGSPEANASSAANSGVNAAINIGSNRGDSQSWLGGGEAPRVQSSAEANSSDNSSNATTVANAQVNIPLTPSTPNKVAMKINNRVSEHAFNTGSDGSFGFDFKSLTVGGVGRELNPELREWLIGAENGDTVSGRTSEAIPVMFTDKIEDSLDGVYKIRYTNNDLSLVPNATKVEIPLLSEMGDVINNNFSFAYQNNGANYKIEYSNGIILLSPQNQVAYEIVHRGNDSSETHKLQQVVIATGVLNTIEEIGIMPDQIRAVYIYTEEE